MIKTTKNCSIYKDRINGHLYAKYNIKFSNPNIMHTGKIISIGTYGAKNRYYTAINNSADNLDEMSSMRHYKFLHRRKIILLYSRINV